MGSLTLLALEGPQVVTASPAESVSVPQGHGLALTAGAIGPIVRPPILQPPLRVELELHQRSYSLPAGAGPEAADRQIVVEAPTEGEVHVDQFEPLARLAEDDDRDVVVLLTRSGG